MPNQRRCLLLLRRPDPSSSLSFTNFMDDASTRCFPPVIVHFIKILVPLSNIDRHLFLLLLSFFLWNTTKTIEYIMVAVYTVLPCVILTTMGWWCWYWSFCCSWRWCCCWSCTITIKKAIIDRWMWNALIFTTQ